jgi:hypothetical protein
LLIAAVSVISKQIRRESTVLFSSSSTTKARKPSSESDWPERLMAKSTGRDHSRRCASARALKAVLTTQRSSEPIRW